MYGVCKLCLNERKLEDSHIIPRAFYKQMKKRDGGQLIEIPLGDERKPFKSNSDPSEHLLCESCEILVNKKYETPSIDFLRGRRGKVVQYDGCVKIHNFDFKTVYLFFISVLWRASASSLECFKSVDLAETEDLLRLAVLSGKVAPAQGMRLNDFLAVSLHRVVDGSGTFTDQQMKRMHIGFGMDVYKEEGAIVFYYMMEGFFVTYCFCIDRLSKRPVYHLLKGELVKRKTISIPKCEITQLKVLSEALAEATKKAKSSTL